MTLSTEQRNWIEAYCQQRDWQLMTPQEWETAIAKASIDIYSTKWRSVLTRSLLSLYGIRLHDCLLDAGNLHLHERAWLELRRWLLRKGRQFIAETQLEDCVQDACERLFTTMREQRLAQPSAIWAFSVEVLRKISIDQHRRAVAQKRGAGCVESLEAVQDEGGETVAVWRETEMIVSSVEYRTYLNQLFQQLPTDQQRQVAHAYFLDELRPVEIAMRMNKKPHQVRQIKQAIIKRLRKAPEFSIR